MGAILVTGGAGFIGSHLVDSLLDLRQRVIVLDDLSGGFRTNINPRAKFIKGSVLNHKLIDDIFARHRISHVFHLAAYAAEGLSHFIKRYNHRNNLIGSVNLINAAVNHRVRCFVFTSSIAVYGAGRCPMTEDMIPAPVDSYGIAKYAVEQELKVTHDLFGLNYIVFRPHNVYGERQNIGDRYRNVIGIFMNRIMAGESMTIFGDGAQTRAFTYIKDVAPVMARSVFEPSAFNEIFNVGADTPVSVNDLATATAKAMNAKPRLKHLPPREEVKQAFSSHEKIRRNLGFEPRYSIEEGLQFMADWARKHGSRKSKRFKNIEIAIGLPGVWRN
jgi:UDP-glucose 4-epimerase